MKDFHAREIQEIENNTWQQMNRPKHKMVMVVVKKKILSLIQPYKIGL